jgi:hypothetical protein
VFVPAGVPAVLERLQAALSDYDVLRSSAVLVISMVSRCREKAADLVRLRNMPTANNPDEARVLAPARRMMPGTLLEVEPDADDGTVHRRPHNDGSTRDRIGPTSAESSPRRLRRIDGPKRLPHAHPTKQIALPSRSRTMKSRPPHASFLSFCSKVMAAAM